MGASRWNGRRGDKDACDKKQRSISQFFQFSKSSLEPPEARAATAASGDALPPLSTAAAKVRLCALSSGSVARASASHLSSKHLSTRTSARVAMYIKPSRSLQEPLAPWGACALSWLVGVRCSGEGGELGLGVVRSLALDTLGEYGRWECIRSH